MNNNIFLMKFLNTIRCLQIEIKKKSLELFKQICGGRLRIHSATVYAKLGVF